MRGRIVVKPILNNPCDDWIGLMSPFALPVAKAALEVARVAASFDSVIMDRLTVMPGLSCSQLEVLSSSVLMENILMPADKGAKAKPEDSAAMRAAVERSKQRMKLLKQKNKDESEVPAKRRRIVRTPPVDDAPRYERREYELHLKALAEKTKIANEKRKQRAEEKRQLSSMRMKWRPQRMKWRSKTTKLREAIGTLRWVTTLQRWSKLLRNR